ncbi:MAG TPA: fused MFS/spermidine synthase [Longimicrobiales bacterium]|nr:fused MFS/spermidine synthase [Longimicrobiales bacterium]
MLPFALLTFTSALLLFLVQPLMARAILPWFGGAASVWTTCLLFYQGVLFLGYAYAHLGARLGMRRQAVLHAVLIGASFLLLPIVPDASWRTAEPGAPTLRLLGLLAGAVGVPYLLLAGTTPLLHAWFARARPGVSPYRLYAVSNAGSLLALLAYPALVEPWVRLRAQAVGWSWAYAALGVGLAALAVALARAGDGVGGAAPGRDPLDPSSAARPFPPPPSAADRALWLALAASGSALLMSITNLITMDIASVPLLWILPLALYLGTFILAFGGGYRRATWGALFTLGLGVAVLLWVGGFALPAGIQVGLASGVLVAGCMVCHGELARSAPDGRHLTGFYLTMAAGGAIGGALVAVVAPLVLTDFFELPASLLTAFAFMVVAMGRDPASVLAGRGRRLALAALGSLGLAAALAFASPGLRNAEGTVEAARNFYGVLRVQDRPEGTFREMRVLRHGRIFHGAEHLDPERRAVPTAYFVEGSGVERAIAARRARSPGEPLRIGVIGLGVGTLAAWTEPADAMRFYEINPDAERLARAHFTFLETAAGAVDVVLGDGRFTLERDVEAGLADYDVLVVDAFAGDAVPVHLLTLECLALYRRSLAEGGVLVFQITNRHVDLERVVLGLAGAAGLQAVRIDHVPPAQGAGVPSSWMVLAEPGTWLPAERRAPGTRPAGPPVLWTDDFSNVLSVLGSRPRR